MMLSYKELENKREIILLVNGEFWKKVRKSLFIREIKGLQKLLTISELEEAFEKLEKKAALRVALDLLGQRSLLEGQIKTKLKERLLSPLAAEYVIARLRSMGYLNEQEEVERAIRSYFNRGFGPRGIFAKLHLKTSLSNGVLSEKIAQEITDEEQVEKMQEIAERRKLLDRNRRYRYLASRGFSPHLIAQLDESAFSSYD